MVNGNFLFLATFLFEAGLAIVHNGLPKFDAVGGDSIPVEWQIA
jgi:hypothetical protein